MFVAIAGFEDIDLATYCCVLPDVSIGNVAQLSMDLLINTLDCVQIGSMFHKSIVPMIGRNAFAKSKQSADNHRQGPELNLNRVQIFDTAN